MKKNTKWINKYLIGRADNENIYLSAPSWDCGWYWGFGYLGNRDCHYHLNGLNRNKNLFDAIKEHFQESIFDRADNHLWTFCELAQTAYTLKEAAEVLGRGGSHYTTNPCTDVIKNKEEVERINGVVLPAIFDAIDALLYKLTYKREKAA
jgi:hypothetical protein